MERFHMNPKAICADTAFHRPNGMQASCRMHNAKRIPTEPHLPRPNRGEMGVRLFKKFLLALVDTASKNLDQTTPAQATPAQLMREAATLRNTQVTSSGKTPMELAMGPKTRDLLDTASMNPEQLTSTTTKQDLLNQKNPKIGHEDSSWITTTRRRPTRSWQENMCRTRFSKDGNLENGWRWESLHSQGPHGRGQYRCDHISGEREQAKETVGLWMWKYFRNRVNEQERLCCGSLLWRSKMDVWEFFSDDPCLSAVLDRQGLQVAAPIDLCTKKAESFSPQLLHGFWHKFKKKNPKIVGMSPDCWDEELQEERSGMATVPLLYGRGRTSSSWRKTLPYFGTRIRKDLVVEQSAISPEKKKYHCQWTLLRGEKPNFSQSRQSLASTGVNTSLAWASGSNTTASTHSSWRLHIKSWWKARWRFWTHLPSPSPPPSSPPKKKKPVRICPLTPSLSPAKKCQWEFAPPLSLSSLPRKKSQWEFCPLTPSLSPAKKCQWDAPSPRQKKL